MDGAVHIAFGGEVLHGARAVLGRQGIYQCEVTQITPHKLVMDIDRQSVEVFQDASVDYFVEAENWIIALGLPVEHESC